MLLLLKTLLCKASFSTCFDNDEDWPKPHLIKDGWPKVVGEERHKLLLALVQIITCDELVKLFAVFFDRSLFEYAIDNGIGIAHNPLEEKPRA